MTQIINITEARIKSALVEAIACCEGLSKAELADLLHECRDRLVTSTGSELIAVKLVQTVALAMLEP